MAASSAPRPRTGVKAASRVRFAVGFVITWLAVMINLTIPKLSSPLYAALS